MRDLRVPGGRSEAERHQQIHDRSCAPTYRFVAGPLLPPSASIGSCEDLQVVPGGILEVEAAVPWLLMRFSCRCPGSAQYVSPRADHPSEYGIELLFGDEEEG